MKLKCPRNDNHKQFSVIAHITQEWKVDLKGDFIEVLTDCIDVLHKPDKDDQFVCMTCSAEAKVED